jgi:hypothetical protein
LIFPPPTWIQLRGSQAFCVEIKCQNLCEFLNAKGTNGRYETLQQSIGMALIRLPDLPKYPFVRLVKTFR